MENRETHRLPREMEDDTAIKMLTDGASETSATIRDVIRANENLAEIYDECTTAANMLAHWERKAGADCSMAVQYRDLMLERVQELRALLQREGVLPNGA